MTAAQKILIDSAGLVTVRCPACPDHWTAPVMQYRHLHAPIGVQCDCGELFDILINTRQFYRQDVNLCGLYTPSDSDMRLELTVENLSVSGLSFRMVQFHRLQAEDELELDFQLDDEGQCNIRTRAIVCWVERRLVGATFRAGQNEASALRDYLQSR